MKKLRQLSEGQDEAEPIAGYNDTLGNGELFAEVEHALRRNDCVMVAIPREPLPEVPAYAGRFPDSLDLEDQTVSLTKPLQVPV